MTAARAGCRGRADGVPAAACRTRAVGSLMADTSTASGPTAAARRVRRFRFVIEDARRADASLKRREAVAEYVAEWAQARIVGESRHGRETVVRVELLRAVPVEVAEEFVEECPHYVRGTFAALGG